MSEGNIKINPLTIILGPTASGKTRLAVSIAQKLGTEIISADSRQIFRGMDIGTGKDLAAYEINGQKIPYHLIDIKDAGQRYHVSEFKTDFYSAFDKISAKHVIPILCGGTGMYVNSILQNHAFTEIPVNEHLRAELNGLPIEDLKQKLTGFPVEHTMHADQSTVKRLIRAIEVATYLQNNELNDIDRAKINPFVIGLKDEVAIRRRKIEQRLMQRLDDGMIEEVRNLLDAGVPAEILTFYGLEYKLVVSYLEQQIDYLQLKTQLFNSICQYAKRQMTFFRKMEKDGVNIHWYQADMDFENLSGTVLSDIERHFLVS